jgi:hypothetical protein
MAPDRGILFNQTLFRLDLIVVVVNFCLLALFKNGFLNFISFPFQAPFTGKKSGYSES